MARIITVHGTFASGPEAGEQWWQRGSDFEHQIRELVTSRDGPLHFEPFIWDGLNSERSRRAAGGRLFTRLAALEEWGEPLCLIGHSHGGSVIAAALMDSARRRDPLRQLRLWMTVGTPFIQTRRQRFLFQRLGLIGKAAYLSVIVFTLLASMALYSSWGEISADSRHFALAAFFGPLVLFHLLFHWRNRRRLHLYDTRTVRFAADTHKPRWLSLWQADDEALQGLKSVKALSFDIFPGSFAVGPLSLLSLLLFPLLCLFLLHSDAFMSAIAQRLFAIAPGDARDMLYSANGNDISQNALVLLLSAAVVPASFVLPKEIFTDGPPWLATVFFIAGAGIFMGAAVIVTLCVRGLAHGLSWLLARGLNPATRAQMKAKAYGSDTEADHAVDADAWPMWLGSGFPPLPDPLGLQLRMASDQAISGTLPKFRDAIRALASVSSRGERSDMLSEYLTWDELIHTSYFRSARFVKLMAYAIAQRDGFHATERFLRDPDYHFIADLYHYLATHRGTPARRDVS